MRLFYDKGIAVPLEEGKESRYKRARALTESDGALIVYCRGPRVRYA